MGKDAFHRVPDFPQSYLTPLPRERHFPTSERGIHAGSTLEWTSAIKQKTVVGEDGRIEITSSELPEGLSVEVIVLVDDSDALDATAHLLSSKRNREQLHQVLEDLKQREKYIYVNSADL